jgi:hypothetical protein
LSGTANVQAKLLDKFYESMKTEAVRLLVVANILLDPSHPVYLLIGTSIVYKVLLVKQTTIEQIQFPSTQYYFESKNQTLANLMHPDQTRVVALNIGKPFFYILDV